MTKRVRLADGFSMLETLIVVALIGIISAIAVPSVANALANFRLSGDTRSVSNAIALVKMRASSNFTRVRLYVDLSGRSHHLESWVKTPGLTPPGHWTAVGGTSYLSTNTSFSYGAVTVAPPSTQATIDHAPPCLANDAITVIANTACVVFNSRGVPIDGSPAAAPTALDAVYLTDGRAVNAVTVSATGMTRVWSAPPVSTPLWVRQ
jgi:prepilin-type N-terminal cleavage/methylation domain-containing protein